MNIYDISITIKEDMVVWKNDPKPKFEKICSIENNDKCNLSSIFLSSHTGTHIDAPSHFIQNGLTIDKIDNSLLFGEVSVIEILNKKTIQKQDLINKNILKRIIFKTDNSELWNKNEKFTDDYTAINSDTAEYLVNKGVKLIGIDYLSIGHTNKDSHKTHKILLSNNVIIVEGLNLFDIDEGVYNLFCSPLKLKNLDGSPARVFLSKI